MSQWAWPTLSPRDAVCNHIIRGLRAAGPRPGSGMRSRHFYLESLPMYQETHVLLVCWTDAQLEFVSQRERLFNVLNKTYKFHVKSIDLPSVKPNRFLFDEIDELKEHDQEGNLLIFYYGGHGVTKQEQKEQKGKRGPTGQKGHLLLSQ